MVLRYHDTATDDTPTGPLSVTPGLTSTPQEYHRPKFTSPNIGSSELMEGGQAYKVSSDHDTVKK